MSCWSLIFLVDLSCRAHPQSNNLASFIFSMGAVERGPRPWPNSPSWSSTIPPWTPSTSPSRVPCLCLQHPSTTSIPRAKVQRSRPGPHQHLTVEFPVCVCVQHLSTTSILRAEVQRSRPGPHQHLPVEFPLCISSIRQTTSQLIDTDTGLLFSIYLA